MSGGAARKTPNRRKVFALGRAWSLPDLAAHLGMDHATLWRRLARGGMSLEEAMRTPVQVYGEDLTGRVFERLTVVKHDGYTKAGKKRYACRCSCGRADLVHAAGADLKSGRQRSCGCIRREKSSARCTARREDITGQVFAEGKVVVLGISKFRRKTHGPYSVALWDCQCHCDTVFQATTSSLKLGQVSSCGCRKRKTVMLFGTPVTLTEMAKLTGLTVQAIAYRLRALGMTPEEAISTALPRGRKRA